MPPKQARRHLDPLIEIEGRYAVPTLPPGSGAPRVYSGGQDFNLDPPAPANPLPHRPANNRAGGQGQPDGGENARGRVDNERPSGNRNRRDDFPSESRSRSRSRSPEREFIRRESRQRSPIGVREERRPSLAQQQRLQPEMGQSSRQQGHGQGGGDRRGSAAHGAQPQVQGSSRILAQSQEQGRGQYPGQHQSSQGGSAGNQHQDDSNLRHRDEASEAGSAAGPPRWPTLDYYPLDNLVNTFLEQFVVTDNEGEEMAAEDIVDAMASCINPAGLVQGGDLVVMHEYNVADAANFRNWFHENQDRWTLDRLLNISLSLLVEAASGGFRVIYKETGRELSATSTANALARRFAAGARGDTVLVVRKSQVKSISSWVNWVERNGVHGDESSVRDSEERNSQ